jgi:p-aminobenzoyl-glutamate transporter AbgT
MWQWCGLVGSSSAPWTMFHGMFSQNRMVLGSAPKSSRSTVRASDAVSQEPRGSYYIVTFACYYV